MNFIIKDVENNKYDLSEIVSYEINKSVFVPCDSLIVTFLKPFLTVEIKEIMALNNGKVAFNGIVDTQKSVVSQEGVFCKISARSFAAILVDTESKPCSYVSPNTNDIFLRHCKELGFENKLPNVFCDGVYTVSKGSSNWGAISGFIGALTGEKIYVNSDKQICTHIPSDKIINLSPNSNCYKATLVYNRSKPISKIRYKIGDNDYIYVAENTDIVNKDIKRNRCINLSSYTPWRQKDFIKKILASSVKNYNYVELSVTGELQADLYDGVKIDFKNFGNLPKHYIKEISFISNSRGVSTQITAFEDKQLQEVIYVDK